GAARSGAIAARLPDPGTLVLVVAAWLAEAVAVWRVSEWFDLGLGAREAVAVLAAAVSIQLVAIAPGGVGTYEAAASTALVATGAPLSTAVTAAVVLHGVKTIYSLVAGSIGLVAPQPSMIGHLRLPRTVPEVPPAPAGDGPVVLFLPARNEAPRAAPVIAAAPAEIDGHPVEVVVIDDGSTDDTAAVARAAGADVVTHETNRGLGAAVRTGFAEAVRRGAVAAAFCDADGEYDPAELATLVRPILDGDAHYVVGSRFRGEIARMLPHRRLGNLTLTRWVRFVTRAPITDGQSGYRALSGAAAASVRIAHDYNYAQVLTVDLVAGGFGYREVPITYAFRSTGRSFVRLGTYLRHVVPTVWRQLNPAVPPGPDRPRRDHEPAHR
ncbi:MAG: glycosyltransferase, partial [Actinomycetota bacterium]|nr:glycosyltransferase [Actinomycetota bacterium]